MDEKFATSTCDLSPAERTNLRLLKKVTQKIPHIKINGVDCSPIKSDNSKRVEASRRASTQPTPLLPPARSRPLPAVRTRRSFFSFFLFTRSLFPRPNPPLPPSRRRRLHPHFQIPASNPDGRTSPPPAHVAGRRTPAPPPENALWQPGGCPPESTRAATRGRPPAAAAHVRRLPRVQPRAAEPSCLKPLCGIEVQIHRRPCGRTANA